MSLTNLDWNSKRSGTPTRAGDKPLLAVLREFFGQLGKKILKWVFFGFFGLLLASVLVTALYKYVPVPITPLMALRVGESLLAGKKVQIEKDWVSLDQISKRMQFAVVAAEDMKFFEHRGFDWEAIAKAYESNEKGKRIRGGSTISQQVAKNVFLVPHRSWIRKTLEAYFTVLIESLWGKQRIMEVYLNVVELGDGVYGVEAASRKYFRKPAKDLNSAEAALISAVLPNPRLYRIEKPSSYLRFRQTLIQRRMRRVPTLIPRA